MSISTARRPRRRAPKLRERLALEFIAHGKTARIDQVAQTLAPDYTPAIEDTPRRRLQKGEDKPPPKEKGKQHPWPLGRHQRIAATLPLVNDWVSWGLALKVHALDDMPDWVFPTEAGLRWLGLPYPQMDFPASELAHLYLMNEVRLFLLRSTKIPAFAWTSERELEMQEPRKTRNQDLPHRPDGVMTIETGGELKISDDLTLHLEAGVRIGVEAERSRKAFEELESILPDLLLHYNRAWYFCGAGAYDAVSKTRATLPPADRQRIQIFRLLPNHWEWNK